MKKVVIINLISNGEITTFISSPTPNETINKSLPYIKYNKSILKKTYLQK